MDKQTEEIVEKQGWIVECYSPLEIRHEDGSFATLNAAKIVIANILHEHEMEEIKTRRYYPL